MACYCDGPGGCPWHKAVTDKKGWEECVPDSRIPKNISDTEPCIYLGKEVDTGSVDQVYECKLYGTCTLKGQATETRSCIQCTKYTTLEGAPHEFHDPLRITDREGNRVDSLRNMLRGGAAFLVCGGPSIQNIKYRELSKRGVFSLGVNNVCGYVPVSAFVCSDPPEKFHNGIFLDPKIIKFLPTPKLTHKNRGRLRQKKDGKFYYLKKRTADCPNVWGFERRSWLKPDFSWFTETSAAWGNHNAGVEKTGEPKTVNTMFLGLRVLQYLGAKHIFLLGADFYMNPALGKTDNYVFKEERDQGACSSNNNQYVNANNWFKQLRPVFEEFGYYTYNCNQFSRLEAFDYVPFDSALQCVQGPVPDEPFDLNGWYAKVTEDEGPKA